MCIESWRSKLILYECNRRKRVLIVTLPFQSIPGFYRKIFPNSSLFFVSFQERKEAISPDLKLRDLNSRLKKIDYLEQHLRLVEQYWNTGSSWLPWGFLAKDFDTLHKLGFDFKDGDLLTYKKVIEQISALFASWIIEISDQNEIDSICVYGRGHWSMNSAAAAAKDMNIPLYVVERGVLEKTYIVDKDMPFSFFKSVFRKNWEEYPKTENMLYQQNREYRNSVWETYINKEPERSEKNNRNYSYSLVIGQCVFDINLLGAPFRDFKSFINLCISNMPMNKPHTLIYRPHPLSPEKYETSQFKIDKYSIIIDRSHPYHLLSNKPLVITWNSTLALEAFLFFKCRVLALDNNCYYRNIILSDQNKNIFLNFIKEISISEDS